MTEPDLQKAIQNSLTTSNNEEKKRIEENSVRLSKEMSVETELVEDNRRSDAPLTENADFLFVSSVGLSLGISKEDGKHRYQKSLNSALENSKNDTNRSLPVGVWSI